MLSAFIFTTVSNACMTGNMSVTAGLMLPARKTAERSTARRFPRSEDALAACKSWLRVKPSQIGMDSSPNWMA